MCKRALFRLPIPIPCTQAAYSSFCLLLPTCLTVCICVCVRVRVSVGGWVCVCGWVWVGVCVVMTETMGRPSGHPKGVA